jgi:chaperonin GroEL
VAGLVLTSEAAIYEKPKEKDSAPSMPGGGGMGGMGGGMDMM